MEMTLDFKKIVLLAVLCGLGYFGYRTYFGGLEGKSVEELLVIHRRSTGTRAFNARNLLLRKVSYEDVRVLLRGLEHDSPKTRALCAEALGKLGREIEETRGSKKLIKLLTTDDSETVRSRAAEALGHIKVREAFTALLSRLTRKESSPDVKASAHRALCRLTGEYIPLGTSPDPYDALHEKWKEWYEARGMKKIQALPTAK